MSTVLPIPYDHIIRYFSKGIDAQGPFYRVEYLIANWGDTDLFVNALLGKSTATGGAGGTITRSSSHQHPLSPNLYCISAEVVEGVGRPVINPAAFPNYAGGAIIRAEYRALMFDIVSQPDQSFDNSGLEPILWATQELDYGHSSFTVANANYKYDAGPLINKPTSIPVKITVPLTTMSLTYEKTPYLAMNAVRTLRYRVNTTQFLGAAAGLVLFEGCRTSRQFNVDGTIAQKTQFIFQERDAAYPWNSLPSRSGLTWYAVTDSLGAKMFQTGDLTPLANL